MLVLGIIIGIIILVLLVAAHEFGHGVVARRNGVTVEEFGIGFPPKAYGKKVKKSVLGKNVLFTLNWLPLGGFVRLKGEHDAASGKGDYGAATFWQKTKILLAGVAVNWGIAIILFTVLALFGLPKALPDQFSVPSDTSIIKKPVQIVSVVDGSPADKAGLKVGDQILRLDGRSVPNSQSLSDETKSHSGKTVELIYQRNGVEKTVDTMLNAENTKNQGFLGIGTAQQEAIKATWSAPIVGVGTTLQYTWATLSSVVDVAGHALRGLAFTVIPNHELKDTASKDLATAGASVSGPIGILGVIFPAAEKAGILQLTFLTAVISLSLAVMNVLPIPALDGGRWFTMATFKLFKKKLTKEREEKIQTAGFLALMALVVIVTIADVNKFF